MGRNEAAQQATQPTGGEIEDREVVKFVTPGQEIYGLVGKVAFGVGKKNDTDLIEVDDEEKGPVTVFLGNLGLQQGLVEGSNNLGRPVQKHDTVYIRFDGSETLESGNTFKSYAVFLEPGDPKAAARKGAAPVGSHAGADSEDLPF